MLSVDIQEYKGYQISYDTREKKFVAVKLSDPEGGQIIADDQTALEEKVDRAIKNTEKTKHNFPIEVFYKKYDAEITRVKITSLTGDKQVWISYPGYDGQPKREKKSLRFDRIHFYEVTPTSSAAYEAIEKCRAEIANLDKQIQEITKTFSGEINLSQKLGIE